MSIDYGALVGVSLLLLFSHFASRYEKEKDGSAVTPFFFMLWPYTVIVIAINTFGVAVGYHHVSISSILFVILCSLFFLIGGRLVVFYNNPTKNKRSFEAFDDTNAHCSASYFRPLFIAAAVISIIASIIHFKNAFIEVGGLIGMRSKDFENAYGKGALSHVIQLNRAAFMFLFVDYLKTKKPYLVILLIAMFTSVLLLQIKTHIMTMILSAIIFAYFSGAIKITFKKLILYAGAIFALFNISYLVGFYYFGSGAITSMKVHWHLINYFFTYLFGGPIAFSEIFTDPAFPLFTFKEVFAVPVNILNKFYFDKPLVNVLFNNFTEVSKHYRYFHVSNVFTWFGMLYMYIGTYATVIFMFVFGAIVYGIRELAYRKNAYIGFKLVYAFWLSFIILAFFGYFMNQLQIYHSTFIMIILPWSYTLFKRNNHIENMSNDVSEGCG